MSYIIEINGYISMSKEIFDDLMNNEINLNTFDFSSEDHGEKGIDVPVKVRLKDYFGDLSYKDGAMVINCEYNYYNMLDQYIDIDDILEAVSCKIDKKDIGYVKIYGEDRERWCYWVAKDMIERGEWKRSEPPYWFKFNKNKPAFAACGVKLLDYLSGWG